jgi:hypothetical protein
MQATAEASVILVTSIATKLHKAVVATGKYGHVNSNHNYSNDAHVAEDTLQATNPQSSNSSNTKNSDYLEQFCFKLRTGAEDGCEAKVVVKIVEDDLIEEPIPDMVPTSNNLVCC